jgi:hypothetical protein
MNHQLHWIWSTRFQLLGLLRYHSIDRKTICWSISNTGFWSMRHNAISEEEVDFKEIVLGVYG